MLLSEIMDVAKLPFMKAVMNLTGHNGICRLNGKTLEKCQ